MTAKQKYYLFFALKVFFMLFVPIIAAGIIWGIIKEPVNNSTMGRVALGAFVSGLVLLVFFSDWIKSKIEQLKLDKRVALMKNHAFMYLGFALALWLATLISDDAVTFCLVAGISNLIAYPFEWLEKKYYREWKGIVVNG